MFPMHRKRVQWKNRFSSAVKNNFKTEKRKKETKIKKRIECRNYRILRFGPETVQWGFLEAAHREAEAQSSISIYRNVGHCKWDSTALRPKWRRRRRRQPKFHFMILFPKHWRNQRRWLGKQIWRGKGRVEQLGFVRNATQGAHKSSACCNSSLHCRTTRASPPPNALANSSHNKTLQHSIHGSLSAISLVAERNSRHWTLP